MRILKMGLLGLTVATAMACEPDAPKPDTKAQTTAEAPKEEPKKDAPAAAQADTTTGAAIAAGGTGDAAKGEATFVKVCAACHGADGKGNGGVTAPDFAKDPRLSQSDAVLLTSIAEGKQGKVGVMPAQRGALSDDEIRDALAYVRKSFSK